MILDPSSLISLLVSLCVANTGISGMQNRSELKWGKNDRVYFQVSGFTMSEPKIEQETLLSILTWKVQNLLGWVCGTGLFWVCFLSWNIYFSEWLLSNFSTWKKIPSVRQSVLASCLLWKINTVSSQELRGGLDKAILQLSLLFFFLCLFEICMENIEKKRLRALRKHK